MIYCKELIDVLGCVFIKQNVDSDMVTILMTVEQYYKQDQCHHNDKVNITLESYETSQITGCDL